MLVVRVELWSGITGVKTEIARMHLINDGTGDVAAGHYDARVYRGRSSEALDRRAVVRQGRVVNYPRLRLHVWNLVLRALKSAGYE